MKEKLSLFTFALISIAFVFEKTSAFELSPGMGYLKAQRKIICSMEDNKPIVYWWYGRMYSRVQGEKDKLLFKVEGMNIRQCDTVKDSKRGNGYRMVSRELLFYQDPESGEILDQWTTLGPVRLLMCFMSPMIQLIGVTSMNAMKKVNHLK